MVEAILRITDLNWDSVPKEPVYEISFKSILAFGRYRRKLKNWTSEAPPTNKTSKLYRTLEGLYCTLIRGPFLTTHSQKFDLVLVSRIFIFWMDPDIQTRVNDLFQDDL